MSVETLEAGRYSIERRLGGGGVAVVDLARDGELNRLVAIKVLAENLAGDDAPDFPTQPLPELRSTVATQVKTCPAAPSATTGYLTELIARLPQRNRRFWFLAGAAAVAVMVIGLALAANDGSEKPTTRPTPVQRVAPGSSPADRARNLADWLRARSR